MVTQGRVLRGLVLMAAWAATACSSDGLPPSPSPVGGAPAGGPTAPGPTDQIPTSSARYVVTFEATWSAATHPSDFPPGPHFSALVGGTHSSRVSFWSEGRGASPGIRDMAERGRTSPLDQEVAAAVAAGSAGQVIVGGAVGLSPGSAMADFTVTPAFPLVTLTSMVAPSPDWFVGVSGLLLAANGQWVEERRVELVPWDAGTDSGVTFTSADRVTSPPDPIARILTAPLSPGGLVRPLGTFVFRRVE